MARDTDRVEDHLDLRLERSIDAPRALVWKAWTNPEHLKKWWAPAPWTTSACEVDLRPGGVFRTVMRSPEGQEFPHSGCYLEIVDNERLVFTTALQPGYRPTRTPGEGEMEGCGGILFTAIVTLAERAGKTHYSVVVLHKDEADRKKHEELGFHEGWNTCLDQLIELVHRTRR